jgi:hypothetical protein
MKTTETLGEAAKKFATNNTTEPIIFDENAFNYFICGAKWQAKRMYSEEEMRESYNQGKNSINSYYGRTFENFLDMLKLKKQ